MLIIQNKPYGELVNKFHEFNTDYSLCDYGIAA